MEEVMIETYNKLFPNTLSSLLFSVALGLAVFGVSAFVGKTITYNKLEKVATGWENAASSWKETAEDAATLNNDYYLRNKELSELLETVTNGTESEAIQELMDHLKQVKEENEELEKIATALIFETLLLKKLLKDKRQYKKTQPEEQEKPNITEYDI